MRFSLFLLFVTIFSFSSQAQVLGNSTANYTRADTLRGSLRPERTGYDLQHYELTVKVVPEEKYVVGHNTITFKVVHKLPVMQVDLFENMQVDSILYKGKKLDYRREYNAVFISFSEPLMPQKNNEKITFYYSGHPIVAHRAPWDGGLVFTKDKNGNPWISTAVQGIGASLWFPNKDHQADEPDHGVTMHVAVPNGLMDVSNGRLTGKKDLGNGYTQWTWKVVNPINNYSISLNIGDYVHFSDTYKNLDLNYYVLSYNLKKAKKQFEQVKGMMSCFYQHFGAYPFLKDGYKLVEAPYLGMEHQSAVTYGNHFENGYLGRDLSGTGVGLKWDFIIIHESGHEWFGNSITAADIADMWIHESFTTYSESVYIECRWGKKDALTYLKGLRKNIMNKAPIIGDYGVNSEGSGDMYYKGANMLNTLRSVINNDEKWWDLIKSYTLHFRHQIINTKDVIDYFEAKTNKNLSPIFDQYLRYANIPVLQLKKENNQVFARWKVDVPYFSMPVDVFINGNEKRIFPTKKWKNLPLNIDTPTDFQIDEMGFYVKTEWME